jgi:predicted branched-subunit amino acid permease
MEDDAAARRVIRRRALSIGVSVMPFGVAYGVAASAAGWSPLVALAWSSLVFTGGTQFAALNVLADGGTAVAAVIAGALLSMRSIAFGVAMAPSLGGPWWRRAAESQLMIDESLAIGVAAPPHLRRYGYLAGGLSVFVLWNGATLAGAVALSSAGDAIERYGLDATIPAAFLALVWPRLEDPNQRWIVLGGAAIALALVPIAPAGVPIVAAALAVGLRRVGRAAAT